MNPKTEVEVEELIKNMINRTKGKYITQGVSFNKNCPRQLNLLKKALMSSASFSGLVKETLAIKFDNNEVNGQSSPQFKESRSRNVGNFI